MKERSFIDTNVLLYPAGAAYPKKQQQAIALLESSWVVCECSTRLFKA